MGIIIHNIIKRVRDYSLCELTHGKENLIAKVWDQDYSLKDKVGKENLLVEIDYENLLSIKVLHNFNDFDSGIFQNNDNYIIKGRVSNIIDIVDDCIFDLYIQTGPEFLTILKSEIGRMALYNEQGVEVEIENLKFFPT